MAETRVIRTPDQRVRVFVSSTLEELAAERQAVRDAVTRLHLVPVLFELGARTHPPLQVYRAYLAQSQVFVGVYWQSYGWVAPGGQVSGLEDEYLMSAGLPRLIYVKSPAPDREPRLAAMLTRIEHEGGISYQLFSDASQLQGMVANDLAVLLSERFETSPPGGRAADDFWLGGTLPASTTQLIGRKQEIAALEELAGRDGVRLITLTGPGGVGKTMLAINAARRLEPRFRDGVRFADLSSVSAPDLVDDAIAAALPVISSGPRLVSDIESHLRTRQLLLLLDNFEQVIAAAPLLAELLAAAPDLTVMVTSRTALRLTGEHQFPVQVLSVPDAGELPDVAGLTQYPAVRLFVERAHAVARDFQLTSGNARHVAEICRRLDGLPLAIELAAAKAKVLPPQALLARLGNPMGLLTGGARDLPARQRTMKSTLDWSFGLLSRREQQLFTRMGVFAGKFDLAAVDAVSDGGMDTDGAPEPAATEHVMDTLGSLVDSSLVRPEIIDDEPRLRMLDTIREYARNRLRESLHEWQQAHDRHCAYFAALSKPAQAELQGGGQLAWLWRLEAEHANLMTMMSWLTKQDPPDAAVELVSATWRFWWLMGHADEFACFVDEIMASKQLRPYLRAIALSFAGMTRLVGGDQEMAQALIRQSLPLFREAGDKVRTALLAAALGFLMSVRRQEAEAVRLLNESQTLLREPDSHQLADDVSVQQRLNVAFLYNFLGQIRLCQGDSEAAEQLFAHGLDRVRHAQDRFTILITLYNMAVACHAQGNPEGAAAHLTEGLSLAAEAGDDTSAAYYLKGLAVLGTPTDNPQRAVRLFGAADALMEAKGSGWLHAFLPPRTSSDDDLATLRSRLDEAAFGEALAFGRSLGGKRAIDYALGRQLS